MRTIEFKSEFKQKNDLESMKIFVSLAYYIGTYRIKSELFIDRIYIYTAKGGIIEFQKVQHQ